ncbi:MAG: ribonuclease HII, partial [Chloroflexi bacterium]|nr:ribonuclease HII [Chloroflexota bacterium]
MPTLRFERSLLARGFAAVAGIDEAGRGAWAGPVVAAAVILPPASNGRSWRSRLHGVNDSKQLTVRQREALYPKILEVAIAVGVGGAGPGEVDRDGIVPATRAAMIRAVAALVRSPDHLLIDAVHLPQVELPQTSIIKGDARALSIAAASIVAKVARDRLMAG